MKYQLLLCSPSPSPLRGTSPQAGEEGGGRRPEEFFIFPPRFYVVNPTLDNFSSLLDLTGNLWVPFTRYLFNSVFVSITGTLGHVLLSSTAAYVLCKHRFKGRQVLLSMIVVSLMFTSKIMGIPQYLVTAKFGFIDTYMALIAPVLGMTLGVVEMLLGGVTSFVDMYYFENRCVETVERLGIRAMLGCNYFDSNVDEVMPQVEEAVRLAAGCDRVQIALAPHSPYTASPENLLRGKRLADKYGLHLMTHISETQDEVRIVREKYGKTSVEHLDGLGLLGPKTIGAHCIHVTDSDIETLAARGVAVSHNPQSNMKISSGVAPVERMRAAGALVTVGTDGTCSNNDLDMFEEVRTAAFLQKSATGDPVALPAWEALRLATVNGARAMGYADGELGVVREGALADLIVVDLQKPHLQPVNDVVSNLVYCGKASDVDTVVVDGRIVGENRCVAGVDLPALYAGVAAAVARIKAGR